MAELFFEDFRAGDALPEAALTIEAEDAASFAQVFGPGAAWPDAPAGAAAPLSGWHVAALGMRLLFESFVGRTASLGAPGIEEVSWDKPVWPGERLRFTGRVLAARPSVSRPGMGLVTVAIALLDREGATVMTQRNAIMVARRGQNGAESGP